MSGSQSVGVWCNCRARGWVRVREFVMAPAIRSVLDALLHDARRLAIRAVTPTPSSSSAPARTLCLSIRPCGLLPIAMSDSGSITPPAHAVALSGSPSGSLAFLNHSPETVKRNLPPDVDNKPLARQKRRRTRYDIPFAVLFGVLPVRDASSGRARAPTRTASYPIQITLTPHDTL